MTEEEAREVVEDLVVNNAGYASDTSEIMGAVDILVELVRKEAVSDYKREYTIRNMGGGDRS